MAELADAQDSDSCPIFGGAGSSPVIRMVKPLSCQGFFFIVLHFVLQKGIYVAVEQRADFYLFL